MATTPRGYPIFTGSMPPAGPVQMQQLAEAVDADVASIAADTGWITTGITWQNSFAPASAVSGWRSFAYRRVGKLVQISGVVTRSTAWGVNTPALTLPPGLWPSRQVQSASTRVGEDGSVVSLAAGGANSPAALFAEFLLP